MIDYLTANPNFEHRNHLIFYHWYERVHNKNVINENVISSLNKSNPYSSKRTLEDDIIDRINENMSSSRFLGFTVYFEYYYDFFDGIEKFSYEEFKGKKFLLYILELFPQIVEIDYKSQKRFFRFNSSELKKLPYEYNSFVVYYKSNNLPSFYRIKQYYWGVQKLCIQFSQSIEEEFYISDTSKRSSEFFNFGIKRFRRSVGASVIKIV